MSIRPLRRAGSARRFRRTRRCRSGRRSPRTPTAPTRKPRPMASRSAPSCLRQIPTCWCWIASSKLNPSIRCFSSRNAGSPGTTPAPRVLRSCSASSRRLRSRRRSPSCWATRVRRSNLAASTASSPIWAAGSAGATTRRSRSTSRWRGCSFPAARCGWRTIAISSSRAASSGTPSRCARGSGSTARAARCRRLPPTTCSTVAVSPTIRPMSQRSAPAPRSASTMSRRSMSPRSRCIRAA